MRFEKVIRLRQAEVRFSDRCSEHENRSPRTRTAGEKLAVSCQYFSVKYSQKSYAFKIMCPNLPDHPAFKLRSDTIIQSDYSGGWNR